MVDIVESIFLCLHFLLFCIFSVLTVSMAWESSLVLPNWHSKCNLFLGTFPPRVGKISAMILLKMFFLCLEHEIVPFLCLDLGFKLYSIDLDYSIHILLHSLSLLLSEYCNSSTLSSSFATLSSCWAALLVSLPNLQDILKLSFPVFQFLFFQYC